MKQIKNFILMSVLLLMGSVCWAQETTKKDSIWGLDVKVVVDKIDDIYSKLTINVEFYSNVKIEDVDKLWCRYQGHYSYMSLNAEDEKNKSKNECIWQDDSIYLVKFEWNEMIVTLMDDKPFEVKMKLRDGTETNMLVYPNSNVTSLNRIESDDNYDIYYCDLAGIPNKSGSGVKIKYVYKKGHLLAVKKVLM